VSQPAAPLIVAVVGPSAAGKSTLVAALREAGYAARHVAQEHSYVPDMWQRIHPPDVLIYLDVSYEATKSRRHVSWGPERREEEVARLAHALQHADLVVDTDTLSAEGVRERVLRYLQSL
jgi:ribose 1,5-bisphosphokinase PhnN